MTAPRADSGFTLVEALVSLFVFSLIATGCTLMLMQSVAAQKGVAEAQAALAELQTARGLLSNDMLQIAPRRVRGPDDAHALSFAGAGADGMAFTRVNAEPNPDLGAVTALAHVQYAVVENRLIRRVWTELDPGAEANPAERVIFPDFENPRFQFYDGRTWREEWQSPGAGSLPRAVAIEGTIPRYGKVRLEAITGAAR